MLSCLRSVTGAHEGDNDGNAGTAGDINWTELGAPDAESSFSTLSRAMEENGRSRVYLGIHFDFDDTVGQEVGKEIAGYIYDNDFVAAYYVPEPSALMLLF
ncbi:MAG: hypothetical protein ACSHX6_13130 [Akkermansiaceae bacterium]